MFELLLQPGSERSQKAFGLNYCASSFVTEGQPSVLFSLWRMESSPDIFSRG